MSEYNSVEWLLAFLALFAGVALLILQWPANSGDAMAQRSFSIVLPIFIALVILVATRYSAVEERKQRKEYEERIEALLKQIAGNRRR